jgi:hypothetical protein
VLGLGCLAVYAADVAGEAIGRLDVHFALAAPGMIIVLESYVFSPKVHGSYNFLRSKSPSMFSSSIMALRQKMI